MITLIFIICVIMELQLLMNYILLNTVWLYGYCIKFTSLFFMKPEYTYINSLLECEVQSLCC